jgi:hypothetical protein
MEQAVFLGALVVVFLVVIYRSGKKQDGFVRHFSRGAFMRDLNKKIENKKLGLRVLVWVISYLFEHTGEDFKPEILFIS